MQKIYGFFEDFSEVPAYNPPRDAPCLFCGNEIERGNVRTHSLMYTESSYAKRSYFYRTCRTCAESDPSGTGRDDLVLEMIKRNGD